MPQILNSPAIVNLTGRPLRFVTHCEYLRWNENKQRHEIPSDHATVLQELKPGTALRSWVETEDVETTNGIPTAKVRFHSDPLPPPIENVVYVIPEAVARSAVFSGRSDLRVPAFPAYTPDGEHLGYLYLTPVRLDMIVRFRELVEKLGPHRLLGWAKRFRFVWP